ncbi:MAG: ChaN family lipoprotein [Rhodobacteraceae bacterium]|nr:ChaN family lipoprotein [Paracoccaceae bacterium]
MKTALKTQLAALLLAANLNGAIAGEIALQDLSTLPAADVVILGETHDNGFHHMGQAAAIRVIKPKAVAFEMLSREQAAKVTPELLPDAKALEAALGWNATNWPDFALYYPVFAALEGAEVVGAARPKSQVRQAFKEGAAAVFGPEATRYGLDQPLPPAQLEVRSQEQFEAHCQAMPLGMMGGMVEAQRFRDAAFAAIVVEALATHGAPVVLIVGAGHARTDWAVPALLKQAEPDIKVLSLAFLEAPLEGDPPFDLWISTHAAEREDPCLVFK